MGNLGNIIYQGFQGFNDNLARNKAREAWDKELERQQKERDRQLQEENDYFGKLLDIAGVSSAQIDAMSLGEKKAAAEDMLKNRDQRVLGSYLGMLAQNAQTANAIPGAATVQAHGSQQLLETNPNLRAAVDFYRQTGQAPTAPIMGMLAGPGKAPPLQFATDPETGQRFAVQGETFKQVSVPEAKRREEVEFLTSPNGTLYARLGNSLLQERDVDAGQGATMLDKALQTTTYTDAEKQALRNEYAQRIAKGSENPLALIMQLLAENKTGTAPTPGATPTGGRGPDYDPLSDPNNPFAN